MDNLTILSETLSAIENTDEQEMIGFYHEDEEYGCFSNWYLSKFKYAGTEYSSVEQYMMYQKVSMFHQYDLADQIMDTDDPSKIKKLGRTRFDGFNSQIWDSVAYTIVKRGVKSKFSQNKELLKVLLSTGDKVLMECSSNDIIWGIGIGIDSETIYNPTAWRGRNQLGRILMSVRDELREDLMLNNGHINIFNARFMEPIDEWNKMVAVLLAVPKYHNAVKAYVNTLNDFQKEAALKLTFEKIDIAMQTNIGGGLPIQGFYEMKQEVYDIAMKRLKYREWKDS